MIGTILNCLFCEGAESSIKIAQFGQYAENVYFGKPSGLMDQMASSVGGFVFIDFKDNEIRFVQKVNYDFSSSGYSLCIVDTGGSHADLTPDYASVPYEMKTISSFFGKTVLREVDESLFYENISLLRKQCSDRAILRAIHFYSDDSRVPMVVEALKQNDFKSFKKLVQESGRSSFQCLQNVYSCKNPDQQGIPLALALSERILLQKGACRVQGGGFAGTIQAFVPTDLLLEYKKQIEAAFGEGNCHVLSIRPEGGIEII